MSIHILQLPDSKNALPQWLEQHFVRDSLGELVKELVIANGSNEAPQNSEDLLPKTR